MCALCNSRSIGKNNWQLFYYGRKSCRSASHTGMSLIKVCCKLDVDIATIVSIPSNLTARVVELWTFSSQNRWCRRSNNNLEFRSEIYWHYTCITATQMWHLVRLIKYKYGAILFSMISTSECGCSVHYWDRIMNSQPLETHF